jgi:phage tail-like protein
MPRSPPNTPIAARTAPARNMRFRVEVSGLPGGGASEALMPEGRIVETVNGGHRVEYGLLTLRRGVTASSDWYDWWDRSRPPNTAVPRSLDIVLLDPGGAPTHRWRYGTATPIAYAVSGLNALGDEVLLETLELAVQDFSAEFGIKPRPNPKPKT